MSRIGRELQLTLQAAHNEAVARRHAYLTVEHLFYALLHSDEALVIFRNVGAQVDRLRAELERYQHLFHQAPPVELPDAETRRLVLTYLDRRLTVTLGMSFRWLA